MTVRAVLPCVVVFLIVAATPAQDTKKELDNLQGEWTMDSLEENGKKTSDELVKEFKLTIKEDRWIVTRKGKEGFFKTTFKIDPSKNPKTIDLTLKLGDKEVVSPGIYKVDGDTLTLCYTDGATERPKEFKIRDKADGLAVWKRARETKGSGVESR